MIWRVLAAYAFCNLWYFVVFTNFVEPKAHMGDSPILRARLGTVLWHSGDRTENGSYHLYCFYPSAQIPYENKAGEYIIKRAQDIDDCSGWLGKTILYEGNWVSEKEKLWWSKEQKTEEELASAEKHQHQI